MSPYQPILNVYVVWHPEANALCQPLAEELYRHLNRDPDKPFERGIGIPIYFRSLIQAESTIPLPIPVDAAVHTVVFVLVEDHMVFDEAWGSFVAGLYASIQANKHRHLLVPVALTGSAFNLHPSLGKNNFVRLFGQTNDSVQPKLLHYTIHCLARLLENRARPTPQGVHLSPLPIKLFISHTKRDAKALHLAEALKKQLDDTQLDRFFDSVDIASGHEFDAEIVGNIENAALLAIRSDRYSSSPWCRMEVMAAKRLNRPMVVVDMLEQREDRGFPYLSNIPALRFEPTDDCSTPTARQALHKIVDFALLEVLRFVYVKQHFEQLKTFEWLPRDVQILSRPPEERDLKKSQAILIIYPDPPLGAEEYDELGHYDIQLATPTSFRGEALKEQAIGISISEPDSLELQALGLSQHHLQNAMLEIARYGLALGATLVYGGDLRKNGFTENLLELVRHHNDALKKNFKPVHNCLAWPLWPTLDIAWAASHKDALKIEKIDAPSDLIQAGLLPSIPPGGDIGGISGYVWCRCLTAMREQIVAMTQARIIMGGRTLGYKGRYPGIVEEALLTLQAGKPLFLLGGYGGAARAVIEALQGRQLKALTEDYQCAQPGYAQLLRDYNQTIADQGLALEPIDYQALTETFADFGIKSLNNGLTEEENAILFDTVNREETIGLILTGLKNLAKEQWKREKHDHAPE